MITFKQYLTEGRFRDSQKILHLEDYPMFAVFIDRGGDSENRLEAYFEADYQVKRALEIARTKITHMGFPSMHVNVVFRPTPDAYGLAHGNPEIRKKRKSKSISLSDNFLYHLSNATMNNLKYSFGTMVDTIVHEWAHIWMFNNGQAFRNAIKQYHEALVNSNIDKIDYNYGDPEKVFKGVYDHLIYNTLPKISNKQNIKLATVQDNVNNILLDKLNDFGMYSLAIDSELIKRYSNAIGKILVANNKNPSEAYKQIRALNMEKIFGDTVKHETQRSIVKRPDVRKQLSDMVKFTGAYGLTNPDETWATALQKFNTLDPYHRKRIFELMQTNEPRQLPNKRMQKHKKAKQTEYLKNVTLDDL